MPTTLVKDDGRTVTLDLHGRSVDEAERIVMTACREAVDRGRTALRLIHGSSTSADAGKRTIRRAVHRMLEEGRLGDAVTGHVDLGDVTLVSLAGSRSADTTPISPWDLD